MKQVNQQNIIPASTVLNTTINSIAVQAFDSLACSIQVVFTGTPTGTFKLQASNDKAYSGNPGSSTSGLNVPPTNWTDVANSSFTVSSAGSCMWDYNWPGFNWFRVVFTDTSGGTSTAIITDATYNAKSA